MRTEHIIFTISFISGAVLLAAYYVVPGLLVGSPQALSIDDLLNGFQFRLLEPLFGFAIICFCFAIAALIRAFHRDKELAQ